MHNAGELFAARRSILIALVAEVRRPTQIGAVHLATSLVASLQLVAAAVSGRTTTTVDGAPLSPEQISAWSRCPVAPLLANIISVTLLVVRPCPSGGE